MPLPGIIENNKEIITALCKKHGVTELYVFGSVVRNDFNADSDIDLALDTIIEMSYLTHWIIFCP